MTRRDYLVFDEFNVCWCDEPFNTFKQAHEFRGAIMKDLHPRMLRITSSERGTFERPVIQPVQTRAERHNSRAYAESDF